MPIGAGAALGLGLGAIQTTAGMISAAKAQKQLEKATSPTYMKNRGILDYYDKALQRYQTPTTETSFYKKSMQDIGRNTSQAISTLTDRGGANSSIGKIIAAQNDATLGANVAAEGMRDQRFGELGQATELKAGEDRLDYQYNKLAPFERWWNLKAQKAAAGNQMANAGISNISGGLNSIEQFNQIGKIYGNSGSSGYGGGSSIMRTRIPIERQTTISRR